MWDFIIQNFNEFLTYTGFANASVGNLLMIVVGAIFTIFLQKIKLSDRKKDAEEPAVEEKEKTVSYS